MIFTAAVTGILGWSSWGRGVPGGFATNLWDASGKRGGGAVEGEARKEASAVIWEGVRLRTRHRSCICRRAHIR
jgi:hypothetical protein